MILPSALYPKWTRITVEPIAARTARDRGVRLELRLSSSVAGHAELPENDVKDLIAALQEAFAELWGIPGGPDVPVEPLPVARVLPPDEVVITTGGTGTHPQDKGTAGPNG